MKIKDGEDGYLSHHQNSLWLKRDVGSFRPLLEKCLIQVFERKLMSVKSILHLSTLPEYQEQSYFVTFIHFDDSS